MLHTILGGRYHITSHLGGGGFGQTYLAEDRQLPGSHRCVVKKLLPVASDPATLQIARRLFDTEAQVLHKLGSHDRIPQLLAYFEENQEFYLVQEFVEGRELSQELTQGNPLGEGEVISLLRDILEVLAFVHRQNVIHRDINPRNLIRRDRDSRLVLIDFGAVKQMTTQIINPQGQTRLSVIIGTPGYMPSEQAHGNPKLSSDIYAVGIIGIQALTGLLPNQLPTDPATEEIIWHDRASVSPELAKVLDKMVRYDFRERYPSAAEALRAIEALKAPTVATVPVAKSAPAQPKKSGSLLFRVFLSTGLIGIGVAASFFLVSALNSSSATDLYNRGNILYNLKRYEEALAAYQKASQIRPDYAEAWKERGKTLYILKRHSEALDAYEKAIQIQPDYVGAWTGRGAVLDASKRYEEAVASFDEALKIQPDSAEAWKERGDALLNLPRYEEAISSYDRAVKIKQDYYEAWYSRGWALHNLQQYEQAVASYDRAVEFKSDYDSAWYSRGNSLLKLGRHKKAVESYDRAIRLKPSHYQAWYSRGNALGNLRQHKEAVESYEKAVRFKPDSYEAWNSMGWALHQLRRYEEAINSYDRAINLRNNDSQIWYNKGNAEYNLKRYERAVASYDSAVYLQPELWEAWYSRGNALVELNRYEDAVASYDKAVQLKPDFRDAIQAQKKARRLLEVEKLKREGTKESKKEV
ncbi:MAG: tetratricopeptide repeat protein [Oscillatoria princeps RMCB-10]|jgi:tetratricopeptide (TPR) repeat protein/predicted Ser/Thr protein kinase|nr:tetratricopeptide repeat protein [Oscillatoria princeps RMCB-10]